jgi:copper(I)-binding protein
MAVAALPNLVSAQTATQQDPPARSVNPSALLIERPWIRATPRGAKVAAGYLRITNRGAEVERLISASIPLAERGEVHEMTKEGELMNMRPVNGGLEIQSGQAVELKPGGYHLMFMELNSGAKEGAAVRGSLTFMKAGNVNVTFRVSGMGGQSSGAQDRR